MKILIAEDDVTSRTMLHELLTKWGYQVTSTGDGKQAYAAFEKDETLQLAVLDWEMPLMDGPSLCRKLRSRTVNHPLYLILLTARDNMEDITQGLNAGADDYLSKPCNARELQARVNVGRRMILLQNKMRAQERVQGVLEMASAICHQFDPPLQNIVGSSELLLSKSDPHDPDYSSLKNIRDGAEQIGRLTHKIMNITGEDIKTYIRKK